METTQIVLPQEIYFDHLEKVNNVRFTRREIDIIAYLFSGRSAKTISSFLSITPKTIETHMRNIMQKLECNSRDGIIDFIEKSDKFLLIKKYYASLMAQACFERQLLKITQLLQPNSPSCLLVYWQDEKHSLLIARMLQHHLKLAGIEVATESKEDRKITPDLPNDIEHWKTNYALYLVPNFLLSPLQENDSLQKVDFLKILKKISENPKHIITFLLDKEVKTSLGKDFEQIKHINFFLQENYYTYVFLVLKQLFPETNFDEIILEFKTQCKTIYGSSSKPPPAAPLDVNFLKVESLISKALPSLHNFLHILKKRKARLLIEGVLCLSALWFGFIILTGNKKGLAQDNMLYTETSIRPDLVIPAQSTFLERPYLMKKIEEALTGPQEIQTVALVGIGGAGKTTLARYYARQHVTNMVWEINAETKEGLNTGFESLADALAKTAEERKKLKEFKDVKNPRERETKVISFAKEKLKNLPGWLLIYDNVEKFATIQEYFPHDANAWGKGKVMILTRDKNIENNNNVHNTIQVAELSSQEKLELFMNIMKNGTSTQQTFTNQADQVKKFLHEIPPFPLDVSIAAYYLKTTNVPYEKYLEHLRKNNADFTNIQENVLKEATNYTKTRYKIITLSLQQLINSHTDFEDLLLFVSLLDFHNIPRDLLNLFKKDVVVENFVYNLKKYSLITHESATSSLPSTFSIHRSTQEISLGHLIKVLSLEQTNPLLQSILHTFEQYVDEVINAEDLMRMKLLVPHCEMILKRANLLNNKTISSIEGKLGYVYYYLSDYKKAKHLLEKNLLESTQYAHKNPLHLANTLMYLGDVYSELGDHKKAKDLCEESLRTYKKHFSQTHNGVARALAHLGNVYRRLGDSKKAKELCEQSLAIYKQNLSENPIRVSWVLAHLGLAHKELGNFEEAKNILEQSLTNYKQNLSDNHARIAWVSAHLGDVYRELGQAEHAKHLLEKSLEIYKDCFSENHVRVAWVKALLGNIYKNLGEYEKAKNLLEESLITYEKNYDKNHTEIALTLKDLGEVYLLKNQIKEGEALISRALATFQKSKHPKSYTSLEIMADLYLKRALQAAHIGDDKQFQSFKDKAVTYLSHAQEITQKHFPMNAPQVIRIQSKLKEIEKLIKSE